MTMAKRHRNRLLKNSSLRNLKLLRHLRNLKNQLKNLSSAKKTLRITNNFVSEK
nr:MAG TPA: hypothetical protein [Caudoviricetes sp.]